jgi:hypothetical protein
MNNLPNELISNITINLNIKELLIFLVISKNNYKIIINDLIIWKHLCNKYFKKDGNYNNFKLLYNSKIYLKCITPISNDHKYYKYYKKYYKIKKNKSLKIGRSRKCDICLLYCNHVSKIHAEFKYINSINIFIKDLCSTNKTYINSLSIKKNIQNQLYINDVINIGGDLKFKIMLK